jgi:hypothetical protein
MESVPSLVLSLATRIMNGRARISSNTSREVICRNDGRGRIMLGLEVVNLSL